MRCKLVAGRPLSERVHTRRCAAPASSASMRAAELLLRYDVLLCTPSLFVTQFAALHITQIPYGWVVWLYSYITIDIVFSWHLRDKPRHAGNWFCFLVYIMGMYRL